MGYESRNRSERRRDRAMVKQVLPEVLNTEILVDSGKKCAELTNTHMEQLTKKIYEESQTFRSFGLREIQMTLSNELFNTNLTLGAFMKVIFKRLNLPEVDYDTLTKEIEAEKEILRDEAMTEAREREAAERKAAKAAKEAEAANKKVDGVVVPTEVVTETTQPT